MSVRARCKGHLLAVAVTTYGFLLILGFRSGGPVDSVNAADLIGESPKRSAAAVASSLRTPEALRRSRRHVLGGIADTTEARKTNATRRLPQALIIGVKKGGTRALLEFIRLHPDVKAVGPETHFFDRHYDRGLEWYRNQMPLTLPGQITMEKTPSYFVTKDAPRRIHNMSREIKLLVVVRDPVTRAISDYAQTASKRPGVRSFDKLIFLNETTGLVDTGWSAVRIGVYCRHLERWLRYFPLRQLHFVNGERLVSHPAEEIAKVERFLDLPPYVNRSHFVFNQTKGFPCVRRPRRGLYPHCLGKTKGRLHPRISNATVQRLREFFRPFNVRFYLMTGINFGWL